MLFESIASAVGLPGPTAGKPYPTNLAPVTQPVDSSTASSPGEVARRVVIAEDEALIRMDLAEMLGEEGYEVVGQAGDGQKAIELARELRPDLVILDVKMPVLDGIAAAEVIASERIAPVVILTAFSQRDLVVRARDAGAMAYLVKPFQRGDLVPAIEMAVTRYGEIAVLEREVSDLQESLATRKSVDRAKGVLQEKLSLSEPDAFRWIQKTAMDLRLSMKQVADGVVEHGVDGLGAPTEADEPRLDGS
jgi:AmiR/NasT family two-component response regulator